MTPSMAIIHSCYVQVPKCVHYIHKGQNCRSEMYSAFMAEVPDPRDPSTGCFRAAPSDNIP